MSQVVLDTDFVSFLFKSDTRAERFLPPIQDRRQIISFMTEAELEQCVLQSRWGTLRVERFREFMMRFVVIPSSRDLIVKWAEVMVAARSVGRRIEVADAWIAAAALLYDAALDPQIRRIMREYQVSESCPGCNRSKCRARHDLPVSAHIALGQKQNKCGSQVGLELGRSHKRVLSCGGCPTSPARTRLSAIPVRRLRV